MRSVLFLKAANHFDDYRAATLIVAAEDRRAVGTNDVAFNDWLNAFAGNDCVHVRAHHDRLRVRKRAGKTRDDVAGVAADRFTGSVDLALSAHLFAVLLDSLRDVALFA